MRRSLPPPMTVSDLPLTETVIFHTPVKRALMAVCRFCPWEGQYGTEKAREAGAEEHRDTHIPNMRNMRRNTR